MQIKLESARTSVGYRDAISLKDAAGAIVTVRAGSLWITQQDDPEDHIVHAGDAFHVTRHGTTVIQAFGPATFDLATRDLAIWPHAIEMPRERTAGGGWRRVLAV